MEEINKFMKVGIIGFANLRYMPYLLHYTNIFDQYGIEYEIIYWDRKHINEEWHSRVFAFREKIDDSANKIFKLKSMLRFRKFAETTIKNRKYDFLVILTTIPAVLLSSYIRENYSKRYLIDIRDYTYEKFFIYNKILAKTLEQAAMRVISSPTFKHFLPKNEYMICHNLSIPMDSNRNIRAKINRKKDVINISYIGAISYFNEVSQFIKLIANDNRFVFSVYGSGKDESKLQDYCLSQGINNVRFYGMYEPREKETFYEKTDIIYNVYGNQSLLVKYALSNKLYDAAWYKIPILVSPHTTMSQMAGKIGFEVDYTKPNLVDNLYNWYKGINWEEFESICDAIVETALKDNEYFKSKLLGIIKRKGST